MATRTNSSLQKHSRLVLAQYSALVETPPADSDLVRLPDLEFLDFGRWTGQGLQEVNKGEGEGEGDHRLKFHGLCDQVVLQNTGERRIGFLVSSLNSHGSAGGDGRGGGGAMKELEAFAIGYGINIALVVDSAYAMSTTNTVVNDAMTIHVVDCGLAEEDREQPENSSSSRSTKVQSRAKYVTMLFVPEDARRRIDVAGLELEATDAVEFRNLESGTLQMM
ncbi:hypothetical protein FB446DRAFT_784550 [Lentinula raphanica]|nr:hypothetical protein FB446DRAFT_784550 [Lentinula raphanica]